MTSYPNAQAAQSSGFGREIAALVASPNSVDVLELATPILGAIADRWSRLFRSVELRAVTETECEFASEPIHAPNGMAERRMFALLLMVLEQYTGRGDDPRRIWTKKLWRGRTERAEITPDGEVKRRYVPVGKQGGLAARLGVCRREVDRYLRVLRAAGILQVWQKKKHVEKLPKELRGKKYAYAAFRWLVDLPQQVMDRVRGRNARAAAADAPPKQPAPLASASPRPSDVMDAEWVEQAKRGALGRSRPPG